MPQGFSVTEICWGFMGVFVCADPSNYFGDLVIFFLYIQRMIYDHGNKDYCLWPEQDLDYSCTACGTEIWSKENASFLYISSQHPN